MSYMNKKMQQAKKWYKEEVEPTVKPVTKPLEQALKNLIGKNKRADELDQDIPSMESTSDGGGDNINMAGDSHTQADEF